MTFPGRVQPLKHTLFPILIVAFLACSPLDAAAQTPITVEEAVTVSYVADSCNYYQLQKRIDGGEWENVGFAKKGNGKVVREFHPNGDYRVVVPSKTWMLVWADEFDGEALDYTKWEKEENNYGGGNFERQAYRTDPKFLQVENGLLKINVFRESHTTNDGKTQPYSSARIRSMKRGDWQYGRFEVRAKMPNGEGIWPAVWMLPTESRYGGWAAGGEIDIIESRGSATHETTGALHFGGEWPDNTFVAHSYTFPDKNASEDFHLYTLEWSSEEIKWFVDGILCQTRSNEEWFSENAKDSKNAPFNQPYHLLINLAVDGRFFEKTDQRADNIPDEDFPQSLEVDYVRVYQWVE